MTPAQSKTVGVNGIELGYEIVGAGEPLVLLHGGFGSIETVRARPRAARGGAAGRRRRPAA